MRRAAGPSPSRLRPGAEPLVLQVERYRRATWGLTAVVGVIALMFVGLFGAFGRPDLGVALGLIGLGPIVIAAWLEMRSLRRHVAAVSELVRPESVEP